MLILERKPGESLLIGDQITVMVQSIDGNRVHLAIDAPKSIPIFRSELKKAMEINQDSAIEDSSPEELLDLLKDRSDL